MPRLILRNARVVEPATSSLLPGLCTVVAEAGFITSVGAPFFLDKPVPTVEVDLDGKYICPYVSIWHTIRVCEARGNDRGLVDCHVHITATPGSKSLADLAGEPQEAVWFRSTYALRGE